MARIVNGTRGSSRYGSQYQTTQDPVPAEDRKPASPFSMYLGKDFEDAMNILSSGAHIGRQALSYIDRGKGIVGRVTGRENTDIEKPKDLDSRKPRGLSDSPITQSAFDFGGPKAKEHIKLVNLDSEPDIQIIELPWVPESISVDPVSNLAAIPSIGRNLPFYHYTGAEDTIEFTIDWFFTNDRSRKRAMIMATTVEAWSKSNGYSNTLPRIKLVCGDLFKNSTWLIEYAPYQIRRLSRALIDKIGEDNYEVIQHGFLPQQIFQEIRLKKISEYNLLTEDYIYDYPEPETLNPPREVYSSPEKPWL